MSDLNSEINNNCNSDHTSNSNSDNSQNYVINKYLFKENGIIKCIYDNNIYDADLKYIIPMKVLELNTINQINQFTKNNHYLDLTIKFKNQEYNFIFYVNYYKKLEYKLYVFYDILFVNSKTMNGMSNLVLGLQKCASDYNYYDISEYKDYILNNIDPLVKDKIINSKSNEDLYIYTNIIEKDKGNCRLIIDRDRYKQYNREIYKQFIPKHTNNYLFMSKFKIIESKSKDFSERRKINN